VIIKSIKPAELHLQFLKKKKCDCYLLQGLESDQDTECKGWYIKSHQKQERCWFYIREHEDPSLYRPLRLKKYD